MKRILTAIAVLMTAAAVGQSYYNNYTKPYFQDNIKVADTAHAEKAVKIGTGIDSTGVIRLDSDGDSLEYYTGTAWVKIGGSGGGESVWSESGTTAIYPNNIDVGKDVSFDGYLKYRNYPYFAPKRQLVARVDSTQIKVSSKLNANTDIIQTYGENGFNLAWNFKRSDTVTNYDQLPDPDFPTGIKLSGSTSDALGPFSIGTTADGYTWSGGAHLYNTDVKMRVASINDGGNTLILDDASSFPSIDSSDYTMLRVEESYGVARGRLSYRTKTGNTLNNINDGFGMNLSSVQAGDTVILSYTTSRWMDVEYKADGIAIADGSTVFANEITADVTQYIVPWYSINDATGVGTPSIKQIIKATWNKGQTEYDVTNVVITDSIKVNIYYGLQNLDEAYADSVWFATDSVYDYAETSLEPCVLDDCPDMDRAIIFLDDKSINHVTWMDRNYGLMDSSYVNTALYSRIFITGKSYFNLIKGAIYTFYEGDTLRWRGGSGWFANPSLEVADFAYTTVENGTMYLNVHFIYNDAENYEQLALDGYDDKSLEIESKGDKIYIDSLYFKNGVMSIQSDSAGSAKIKVKPGNDYEDVTQFWRDDDFRIENTNAGRVVMDSVETKHIFMNNGSALYKLSVQSTNLMWNDVDALTSGTKNIGIGYRCGAGITSGVGNVSIGEEAGFLTTTASHNISIGEDALRTSTNGGYNVSIGNRANRSITSGSYNTSVGNQAGYSNTTSLYNVCLGYGAGYTATGASNVFLGNESGYDVTTGTHLYIANGQDNGAKENTWIYGNSTHDIEIPAGALYFTSRTIADNDATPDVSNGNVFTYAGSANAVTITDLDSPVVGSMIHIIGNSDTYTVTIGDSGNFNLSAQWVGGVDDVLILYVQADNDYIEIGRVNN